ncbi:MAG TPA: ABC transporter permease [Thermoanaerobaculia bacterium]|nr:ABC transporter permease [Thermoanaerobaculia bacterium]
MLQDLWQDIRYGTRRLAGSPGFTAVALLTLALGIGAISAIFTLVNAVLLGGLPYGEPERLVLLSGELHKDNEVTPYPVSYLDLQALQGNAALDGFAAVTGARPFNLQAEGEVEHISGEMVTADFFRVLGVEPQVGRTFRAEEDRPPGSARVVVLSDDLWRRRFGGDRGIVGKNVQLSDQSYQVIGVMKPGFLGLSDEAQLWLPIGLAHNIYGPHYIEMRMFRWLSGVARLKPGVSAEQARQSLDQTALALEREFPEDNEGIRLAAMPLFDAYFGELRPKLLALLGASALVLLIACVNVANLLLARASARGREMSLRSALGAGSFRLIRQLLTESLLLAVIGSLVGLLVASWFSGLLVATSGMTLASFLDFGVDWTVIGVTFGLSVLAGALFGLVPALLAARVNLQEGLKEGSQSAGVGSGRRRFQSALVVAEVALALSLLAGAGLMIKGLRGFLSTDLGFQPENVLTLRLDLTSERYKENEPVFALVREALARVEGVAGVEGAAMEGPGYPTGGPFGSHLIYADREAEPLTPLRHHVTPGYFQTLGIPMLAGRDFSAEDTREAPRAMVVSESMAKRYWPGEDPLGKRLKGMQPGDPEITVVGVVGDVKHAGLTTGQGSLEPDVYFCAYQSPPRSPSLLTLLVRTSVPPEQVVAPVQQAIKEVAPDLPTYDVATLQDLLDQQTAEARFLVFLMSVFAGLALTLAAIGVYGVLAYTVTQRTREIGIRVALGAHRNQVIGMVVRRGLALVSVGVLAGLVVVMVCNRFVTSWLYGVSPSDPLTLVGTAVVLLLVALAASYLPARRATRIQPVIALRSE